MIKLILKYSKLFIKISTKKNYINYLEKFFNDEDIRSLTGVNIFEEKQWYHSSNFKLISLLLFISSYLELYKSDISEKDLNKKNFNILEQVFSAFYRSDNDSGNIYDNLKRILYKNIEAISS
ncbi:MAG: hypothetical protein KAS97_01900 [Candidatus Aminicenantes bacterium]|nr:hypothetical protein [Candidatus Aminicenantes bacterium]